MAKTSADFIGRRSLTRSDTVRKDRKQLVGLLTEDPSVVLMEGAHIIATAVEPVERPAPALGHVTSSYKSPNLNRSIALALVKGGSELLGQTVYVSRKGADPIHATIVETDFMKQVGNHS